MENEWFCTKCNRVFISKSPKCCGGKLEPYNPIKHSKYIIGKSNTWIDVWETWKDHPLLKEISYKLHDEGCYSAPIILNEFIRKLFWMISKEVSINSLYKAETSRSDRICIKYRQLARRCYMFILGWRNFFR